MPVLALWTCCVHMLGVAWFVRVVGPRHPSAEATLFTVPFPAFKNLYSLLRCPPNLPFLDHLVKQVL